MKDHLDASALNALLSGELSREERALAREHLAECASCTTSALSSAMLKLATAKAGVRFVPSVQFTERITRQSRGMHIVSSGTPRKALLGWAMAAVLAIVSLISIAVLQRDSRRNRAVLARSTLTSEIVDSTSPH